MKRATLFISGVMASFLAATGAVTVTEGSVALTHDEGTGEVTISYGLTGDGPCVVTVGIETNAGENVWLPVKGVRICGDANRLIHNPSGVKKAYWLPNWDIPGCKVSVGGIRAVVSAWATNAPPDYMAVEIVPEGSAFFIGTNNVRYYVSADAVPLGVSDNYYKTNAILMRKIPAAEVKWRMGSPEGENGRKSDETAHDVTLSSDYYIGVYEFTKGQYFRTKGSYSGAGCSSSSGLNGLQFGDPRMPVEYNYFETVRGTPTTAATNPEGWFGWPRSGHDVPDGSLIGLIRARTGIMVDLPTEAQWEYACRAGHGTSIYTGSNTYSYAPGNFNGGSVVAVGGYAANAWGLYDMYGNVYEFVLDRYEPYSADSVRDPEGADGEGVYGTFILRGGSFYQAGSDRRSAARKTVSGTRAKTNGFRLVCPAEAVR